MKTLLIALSFVFLFACSSAQHKAETASTEAKGTVTAAASEKATTTEEGALTCSIKKEVRVLKVVAKDKGCELQYTKGGKTETKATSAAGTKHCEDVRAKMQKNLETAGYSCK